MPILLNSIGDENACFGRTTNSKRVDSGVCLPLTFCMESLSPLCKKPPFNATASPGESNCKANSKDVFTVLPDECLLEIFRCLPGARARSICACVSKHWLMLQSSMRRGEFKKIFNLCPEHFGEISSGSSLNNTGESPAIIGCRQPYYESHCDETFCEDTNMRLESIDIDGGSKGAVEKGSSEKPPKWSIGDLSRHLEGKKATDTRLAAIAVGTAGCGGLGELLIRSSDSSPQISDAGLSVIGIGCPVLRVLSLWGCSLVNNKGIYSIAKGCTLLEKLDVCMCPRIGDNGLEAIAQSCPNILTLNIESCPQVGNKSLKAIGQHCSNLQSLCVIDCPLVDDEGILSVVSNSMKLLKVKLQTVKVTDASLAAIGYYGRSLTDLLLANLQNVTEKGFWCLGNALGLQKLKIVSVTSCRGLTNLGFEAIGQGCPSLKQVFLRKCESLSNKGLIAFTEVTKSLENLQIENCNLISHFGLIDALANCSRKLKVLTLVNCQGIRDSAVATLALPTCESLRTLNIRYCQGFGNECLALMGSVCPHVQHLDLSGLSGVCDDGLLAVLKNCGTRLVKVNLSGCGEISDRPVCALANMCGESLQALNLDGCRKVTDQSLKVIANCCPALQVLDMSKCGITDDGIISLVSTRQRDLQILSLSGCKEITDKCLPYITKMGDTLLSLNLQHCCRLSRGALDSLEAQLWRCDLLLS